MRKKNSFVGLLCVLAMLFSLLSCASKSGGTKQADATPEKAILRFLSEEQNVEVSPEQLDEMILNRFMENDAQYCLLKGTKASGDKSVCYVYVVKVEQIKNDSYICEKFTADYFLESPEGVNDAEYTPYLQYTIPVEKFQICVGMVFDVSYEPYFQGRKLDVNKDGIFVQIVKESGMNVEMKRTRAT